MSFADVRAAVENVSSWYHTMDLAPGVVTKGWFDLRPIVDLLPWPDVRGKRCLDVGSADGFLAFEIERRGASEVVAIDLPDHADWDFSVADREGGTAYLRALFGSVKNQGFEVASTALGSRVRRVPMSVYDLSAEHPGRFDIVVCGSMLLHLKEPLRALEAIRSVCDGWFMSAEAINLRLTLLSRRRPGAAFLGGHAAQWWVPNLAAHQRMVESVGFRIVQATRPYAVRFGQGHPPRGHDVHSIARAALQRVLLGSPGVPHAAVLAEPV